MRGYQFQAGERLTAEKLNRGDLIGYGVTIDNVDNIAAAEVPIIATSTVTFEPGRAYEFQLRGLVRHATANLTDIVFFRLRQTSELGQLFRNLSCLPVTNRASADRNHNVSISHIAGNNTALPITVPVVATASRDSGSTATFTWAATPLTPATLSIYDLGPLSDYPGIGGLG